MVPYEEGNPDFVGYPGEEEELTDASDEDWFSIAHDDQLVRFGEIIEEICAIEDLENMYGYYEE